MEEYRNAFELIRIAQRLDPMSPQHYVSGASVALGAGDWDLAIRECHKAIELGRQSALGYYNLGLAEHFQDSATARWNICVAPSSCRAGIPPRSWDWPC